MSTPPGAPPPHVIRQLLEEFQLGRWVTDPAIGISRNDQLRIVGNGVCPQQAVAALTFLLRISEATA